MALSHTDLLRLVSGHKRVVITETTFDSSYSTGGESLTAADLGLVSLDAVFVLGATSAAGSARTFAWDRANGKLIAYGSAARTTTIASHTHTAGALTMDGHVHVENAAGSYTQNANTASTTATGSGAATGGTVATGTVSGTAGDAFAEVVNATSLATVKVNLLAIGS